MVYSGNIPLYVMAVLAVLWSPLWCACHGAEQSPAQPAHTCCDRQTDHRNEAPHHTTPADCDCSQHHEIAPVPPAPSTALMSFHLAAPVAVLTFTPAEAAVGLAPLRPPHWGDQAKPAVALTLRAQFCLLTI